MVTEIEVVHFDNHTKFMNTFCGKTWELPSLRAGGCQP